MTHTARATFLVLAACTAALIGPVAVDAQVIQGRLIDDDSNRGIDGGIMSLLLGERVVDRILSDSVGDFELLAPAAGVYSVTASRIGYEDTRGALLDMQFGDTIWVEFRLQSQAILLEPMLVTATSRSAQAAFRRRMNAGVGQFLTRPMLDTMDLWHVGQVFRKVEGFNLSWEWGSLHSPRATDIGRTPTVLGMIPKIRSYLGHGCVGFVLDNVVAGPRHISERGTNPWSMYPLDTVLESEIMGMEFYRYIGEVPEELRHLANDAMSGMGTDGMCGLVVIWTRARWGS